jgi:hypothetical protein
LKDISADGKIILKWIVKKKNVKAWTEIIRFRIGHSERLLWTV